jgi:predicted dehydrogenase
MNPDEMLRIAIAGCGSIGRRHLANLRQLTANRQTEIFVYDAVPAMSEAACQEIGVTSVQHLNELWDMRPDIALICTPSHLHTSCALSAAHSSNSVALFIEKPVAHTLDGLAKLETHCDRRGLITLVGCNMRFHPGPAQIKRWLSEGLIGEVLSARLHTGSYLPAWRPQQDYRTGYSASTEHGGAILDCIHEIDLALWLLGPATLHAALVRPAVSLGLQTDGLAELLFAHTGGASSSIHLNFVQRNYRRSIEIIGSEGSLAWDFTQGAAVHYGPDGDIAQYSPQPAGWNINQMYLDELAYFLCCAASGEPTFNTVSDATQTLSLALQARQSHQ